MNPICDYYPCSYHNHAAGNVLWRGPAIISPVSGCAHLHPPPQTTGCRYPQLQKKNFPQSTGYGFGWHASLPPGRGDLKRFKIVGVRKARNCLGFARLGEAHALSGLTALREAHLPLCATDCRVLGSQTERPKRKPKPKTDLSHRWLWVFLEPL